MIVEFAELPPSVRARVESELLDDEEIVWIGQPRAGRAARSAAPLVVVGIVFLAVAVLWIVMISMIGKGASNAGAGSAGPFGLIVRVFAFLGIPFGLLGAGMMLSPLLAATSARRTVYAITSRRAILFEAGLRSTTVRSYHPGELDKVHRVEGSAGAGDLIFEEYEVGFFGGDRTPRIRRHGFMGIDDVAMVERVLRSTLHPE